MSLFALFQTTISAKFTAHDFAWASVAFCTVATIYCANRMVKDNPRLFSAHVLYAMSWAILLPYYSVQKGDELLPAFSGLLLIFAGAPLRREAESRKKRGAHEKIHPVDRWAIVLLLLLVVPHLPFVDHYVQKVALGILLNLLGYFSVVDGVRKLVRDNSWLLLATCYFLYVCLEVAFLFTYDPTKSMPEEFLLLFGLAKLICAPIFLVLINRETQSFRSKGWKAFLEPV